ncbi:MAG: hypothetical protein CMF62_02790 [Magnetococcales bacterium]|nr:hypothetical protein [Magnetococcales bacterium]|tara:strand:+ start:26744 stop:28225 length:1482 start_codon:yes stop_codon:yes gene_type:complete
MKVILYERIYISMDLDKLNYLPEEIEEGNVEYKFRVSSYKKRQIELATQLIWRLEEGYLENGSHEAHYYIGVNDDGTFGDQSKDEINASIINFEKVVNIAKAEMAKISLFKKKKGYLAYIKVRKHEEIKNFEEVKVALLGGTNNGKSTTLSVLTYGYTDNGLGSARKNVFRYDHEINSGETSSIKTEILGYNDTFINYSSSIKNSWKNIVENSSTIINFIDLPGNPKYIKTTLFGLNAYKPDFAYIFVEPKETNFYTKQMIYLCEELEIPYKLLVTKIDLKSNIIKDHKKLYISNVTLEGYDKLYESLRTLKPIKKDINEESKHFQINEVIYIQEVGIVLIGKTIDSYIEVDDKLYIGPFDDKFYEVNIESIHQKQIPIKRLNYGESGSIRINFQHHESHNISKHMHLISEDKKINFKSSLKVSIDEVEMGIGEGSLIMIFTNNVIEMTLVEKIVGNIIHLKFIKPNISRYLKLNDKIVLKKDDSIKVGTIVD